MYTIGVKRLFGFKKYFVKGHRHEFDLKVKSPDGREGVYPIRARLVLTMTDSSVVVIPNIEEKEWKIYPDFFEPKQEVLGWQSEAKNFTEAAAQ